MLVVVFDAQQDKNEASIPRGLSKHLHWNSSNYCSMFDQKTSYKNVKWVTLDLLLSMPPDACCNDLSAKNFIYLYDRLIIEQNLVNKNSHNKIGSKKMKLPVWEAESRNLLYTAALVKKSQVFELLDVLFYTNLNARYALYNVQYLICNV